MIDMDYELLCGQPRLRRIYYFGGWYTVAATDIGRAPQPETSRTGEELLSRESLEKDRSTREGRAWVRRAIIGVLRDEPDGLNVRQIADRINHNPKAVVDTISKNKDIFETWLGPFGRGPGITWAKLRENHHASD